MKKLLPLKRQRFTVFLFHFLFFSLIHLLSGCSSGSYDNLDADTSETASATFTIAWHEPPDIQVLNVKSPTKAVMRPQTVVTAQAQSVNCELIDVIECIVYDGSNNDLTSATFECSAHQGTINNIPAGSNRKFVSLGVDADGNILYHGEILGVTIAAGRINDLGTIDAYYFIPTGLSATAVSPNRINLSWSTSSGNTAVKGYNLYRNGTFLKSVNSTSTSDTGLGPSTRYCYRVSAYDEAGNESGLSSQECATTPQTVDGESPTIPTGLSAAAVSSNQIDLSWNASTDTVGVAGYKIYRNGAFLKSVSTTPASDTGLSPLTRYCYRVSAFDAAGNESGLSSQECATTPQTVDGESPTIPTGLSAAAVSLNQIDLSWNASTDTVGVAGYKIYRNGAFLKSVSTTSTSDTGLSLLTRYCYRVSAFDAAGNESGLSSQECATTPQTVDGESPTIPTGLSAAAVSSNQIDLSWEPSSDNVGVAGYNIYRYGVVIKSVSDTATSDTGLGASVQYCYRVSAFDAAGNESGQSNQECTTTPAFPQDTTAPAPDPMIWATEPFATSTSEISMAATTASDSNTPITYLFDFVSSPTGGSGGNDSMWQSSTNYTDSGLDPNQQYGYRVRARDAEENATDYSSTSYAYTLANMPGYPPDGPFSNVTENSIRVSWTANGNPFGTEYYCENMDNKTNSGWTTALYWDSTGLLCDTSYEYRVRARSGDRTLTPWRYLDNQYTQSCSDINIMIGDNDGYGYGIKDGQPLPTSSDPVRNWIFDNRESTELSANDGSQHTDYEPYNSRQFSIIFEFPPVNQSAFSYAELIVDVSGIQETVFGPSSLYLDGLNYSDYLPESQGTFGSDIFFVSIGDPSILEDGKLTVNFQGGLGLDPNVWNPDAIAFDFFELNVFYYGE